jgi:DnaJ family protein C protein 28
MKGIEEQIRKAIEAGEFKDLPGKGKPLKLEDNPLADPEWRLANQVLRDGGYTLPWIEARQEIEASLEKSRLELASAWEWRQTASLRNLSIDQAHSEWSRAVEAFRQQVKDLNKLIQDYNLQTPSDQFQRLPLNADREIEKFTASEKITTGKKRA